MYACQNGCIEAVESFLSLAGDLNVAHKALFWAAGSNDLRLVERIPDHPGVEVNTEVFPGATPILAAADRCDVAMVRFLLQHGADPEGPKVCCGPIRAACCELFKELKNGANIVIMTGSLWKAEYLNLG